MRNEFMLVAMSYQIVKDISALLLRTNLKRMSRRLSFQNTQHPFQDVKIRGFGDTPWPNLDPASSIPLSKLLTPFDLCQLYWRDTAFSGCVPSTSREIASFLTLQHSSFFNILFVFEPPAQAGRAMSLFEPRTLTLVRTNLQDELCPINFLTQWCQTVTRGYFGNELSESISASCASR